jgi:outer membrane protein TolC
MQAHNPELQSLGARYDAAREVSTVAGTLPAPMLQWTHMVEPVQTRTGPQENVLMLNQRIPWFGKLDSQATAASAAGEAVWYATQGRLLRLTRQTAKLYFDYAYSYTAAELTRRQLDLLEKLEPVVTEKVRGGDSLNSLLRLRVEIGKVTDQLDSIKQSQIDIAAQLRGLLAIDATTPLPQPTWAIPSHRPNWDRSSLAAAVAENHPELKMVDQQLVSDTARERVARLESYPDLTLGINYIQVGDPVVNPATPDAGRDPWGVTVSVSLPIWASRNAAIRTGAEAGRRATEAERETRLHALQADLSSSLARFDDAQRRLKVYGEDLLDLASQAATNTREAYRHGDATLLEVIDSERSLLDLQLQQWRAAADSWHQLIAIHTLTNQPVLSDFSPLPTHE